MIFADKLIALRKKAGYSQEELAQQLNVTRQSVSKWEGAQSVPDIEKILQISKLFGVTTDYLLKDEMGEPEYAESEPTALRRVTLEQANAALTQAKVNAPYMAWGTALCVASPVMLLLLGEICQHSQFGLNENVATGIGLCVLLVMVCVAVVLFMLCDTKNRDFDFLEKEPFETEYGVTGMVRERQAAYRPTYEPDRHRAVHSVRYSAVCGHDGEQRNRDECGGLCSAGVGCLRRFCLCAGRDLLRRNGKAAGRRGLHPPQQSHP